MGYFTYYTLSKIKGSDEQYEKLVQELKNKCDMNFNDESEIETTWYEHDDDMLKLSKKFPELIVQLYGIGENCDDVWVKRYHNGKVEEVTLAPMPEFIELGDISERQKALGEAYDRAINTAINIIGAVVREAGNKLEKRICYRADNNGTETFSERWCNSLAIHNNEIYISHSIEIDGMILSSKREKITETLSTSEIYTLAKALLDEPYTMTEEMFDKKWQGKNRLEMNEEELSQYLDDCYAMYAHYGFLDRLDSPYCEGEPEQGQRFEVVRPITIKDCEDEPGKWDPESLPLWEIRLEKGRGGDDDRIRYCYPEEITVLGKKNRK